MTLAHERASQFLEGFKRNRREIVTPEGVPIPVELAEYGERFTALAIDIFLCCCLILLVIPIGVLVYFGAGLTAAVSVGLLLFFAVRIFYFVYFELVWRGATPGKRALRLRVVDRRGGPLLPSAIIARNLTREIECFLPLQLIASFGGAIWQQLFTLAWLLFFSALPFINRDRMRGGDLIAGTMVIAVPRRVLSADLVELTSRYTFTDQQLKAYGAFELQVLEELLRHPDTAESTRILADVRDKICRRIDWRAPIAQQETIDFLRDFYTAQRAFLERRQLFGKARADKHAQLGPGG